MKEYGFFAVVTKGYDDFLTNLRVLPLESRRES